MGPRREIVSAKSSVPSLRSISISSFAVSCGSFSSIQSRCPVLFRAKLRKVPAAPLADRGRLDLRAITWQDQAQLGQPHVAILLAQLIQPQPAAALAAATRDLQHCDLA